MADAIVSGFGVTVAPRIDIVRANGTPTASEVRRTSTATSQTPACGFDNVRLVACSGEQLSEQPGTGGL